MLAYTVVFLAFLGPSVAADKAPRVSAAQLIEAFWTNGAAVDEYYLEKEVVVSGSFRSIARAYEAESIDISRPFSGEEPRIVYAMKMDLGEAGKESGLSLIMLFDGKHRAQLAELKRNEHVTVIGTCKRYGRSVTIEVIDCRLVAK